MKKKAAIVTGASSGIGECISKMLSEHKFGNCCDETYEVFGFGRVFSEESELSKYENFHAISCDLLDTEMMTKVIKEIKKAYEVTILVNNAGVGYYGLHEELNTKKIQVLVRTNLELPMILTNLLLRDIKKNKGYIIHISSVTANLVNPHGCAYGATKAGLTSFAHSLYEETRKYGVKVITIQPDMTQTNLYRNADFEQGEEIESYLRPQEVAEAIEYVLGQRDGVVITDITLRPQLHRIRRK